jgi:ribose-phosphate pyrophosphokinase
LTGEAVKKINKSKIKKFVISNSIMNDKKIGRSAKFQVINVGTLLAEAIKRISISKSVSKLFK